VSGADKDDFFIGWAATGRRDRRFLLGAFVAIAAGGGFGAYSLARSHAPVGSGTWDQGAVRDWTGYFMRAPYPMLLTRDIDGALRTAFIGGSGKVSVRGRLGARGDGWARVRGSLIARGRNAMIAAVDGDDWIADIESADGLPAESVEDLGEAHLIGEILDAKCWFGAMRPGDGPTHKSCAALCVAGGLPPAFCVGASCGDASMAPLLLDENGAAHGPGLLPLVADPVRAQGRLARVRDVVQFRVSLDAIARL
jgi:hypothetical protein